MTNDFTPTTDDVRRGFTAPLYKIDPQRDNETFSAFLSRSGMEGHELQVASEKAFNRWLAEHDRTTSTRITALLREIAEVPEAKAARQIHELCRATMMSVDDALQVAEVYTRLNKAEAEWDKLAAVIDWLKRLKLERYLPGSLRHDVPNRLATADTSTAVQAIQADAWDECLDEIDKYELNTEQARDGNPYRASGESQ